MLKDEVGKRWQLPLPKDAALETPGCKVAPLGIVIQSTIDDNGDTQSELRLTHNQSFNPKGTSGRSVKVRVDDTTLTPATIWQNF